MLGAVAWELQTVVREHVIGKVSDCVNRKLMIFCVYFQGGREVDDFVKYLAKEATEELSGYNRDGKKKKSKVEL